MIKLRRTLFILGSLGLTLLLSGCKLAILDPKGIIAAQEKQLLLDSVMLMLIVVIPVVLLAFWIAWRYRSANLRAKYSPHWGHSTILELGWWLIPCIIITILAVMTWRTSHDLDPYKPVQVMVNKKEVKPITIEAVALDWKWLFIYPDQHVATVNFVQIPIKTPIRFLITSDAPMNSFDIPQLAGQVYAMAGMQTKLYVVATAAGDYNGQSSNFSGDGFSGMKFVVRVGSDKDFDNWLTTVKKSSSQNLTMTAYKQLATPSENNPVTYYSGVDSNLFNQIMMKYMMPMPGTVQPNDK